MKKFISAVLFIYVCSIAFYSHAQNWMWGNAVQNSKSEISGEAITTDLQGNSYVTGRYFGTTDFGKGITLNGIGAFVAKYDDNGSLAWVKGFTGIMGIYVADCAGYGITLDNQGNIYVTGAFAGQINFAGTILTPQYDKVNAFVAKMDSSGNILWVTMAGDAPPNSFWTTSVVAEGIAVDAQGNAYITGSFSSKAKFSNAVTLTASGYGSTSASDAFIAKYDSMGNFQWAQQGGATQTDQGLSITAGTDGFSFITGMFQQSVVFDNIQLTCPASCFSCTFIASYNTLGQIQWANLANTDGQPGSNNRGNGITTDNFGNSFVTGYFQGTIILDGLTIQNPANDPANIFIAMYDKHGLVVWGKKDGGPVSGDVATTIAYDPFYETLNVGGFYAAANSTFNGNIALPNFGNTDIFIARYAALDGKFHSVNNITNGGDAVVNAVSFGDHSFYVTGNFTGDPFVFHKTPGGQADFTLSSSGQNNVETGYVAKYRLEPVIPVQYTGIESNITFYPNPANDQLTVKVENGGTSQILITTLMGETLQQTFFDNAGEYKIDVNTLPEGLYILKTFSGDKIRTEHISINR